MFNQTPRTGITIMCAHYFYSDEGGSNMPWIISNGKSYVEIIGNNQMITTAYSHLHSRHHKRWPEGDASPESIQSMQDGSILH